MRNSIDEIKALVGYDVRAGADANLEHLLHFFEGYRDTYLDPTGFESPYARDCIRDDSWNAGSKLAVKDQKLRAAFPHSTNTSRKKVREALNRLLESFGKGRQT